ncbi:cupin domain-containing protein [Ezakiella peruensis]|uniref:cupin domain-containing protein n=1 Tax=Ezakiella peruensis TaxID=1464038 RepID=UPI000C1B1A56|nr:cupin domain-containing protein [Ezakiella peruensis]
MKDRYKNGIFSYKELLPIKAGHTLSLSLSNDWDKNIYLFGLAKGTDISEELYDNKSLYINLDGSIRIGDHKLSTNQAIFSGDLNSYAIYADEDSYLLEISYNKKEDKMLKLENMGQVFSLKDVITYLDGGISNYDVYSRDDLKIVLMAFDAGEGLTPHTAPGDALIFALEGEADMEVGDETHRIKAGEQIVFPKGVRHNVTAVTKFKMALILVK